MWTIEEMKIKKKNIVNNFHLLTKNQRLPNMLAQRLYNMLGQCLYNMLGQRFFGWAKCWWFCIANQRWPNENCSLKPIVGPTSTCYLGSMFCSCFLYWNIILSILWNENMSLCLHHTFGISNYLMFRPNDWPLWTFEKKKLFELSYLLNVLIWELLNISYNDLKNRNAVFKWPKKNSNRF